MIYYKQNVSTSFQFRNVPYSRTQTHRFHILYFNFLGFTCLLFFSLPSIIGSLLIYQQFTDKYPDRKILLLFGVCQRGSGLLLRRLEGFCSDSGDSTMERQKKFVRTPLFVAKGFLLIISFFAGLFGAFFSLWKHNYYGTASFLLLELVSVFLLQLNVKHMKGQLFPQCTQSKLNLLIFGCAMFLVSLTFSIFLLVMGVKYETEFNFTHNNPYFAFVPCLVSNFWYALLVYEIRNFMKLPEEQYGAPKNIG